MFKTTHLLDVKKIKSKWNHFGEQFNGLKLYIISRSKYFGGVNVKFWPPDWTSKPKGAWPTYEGMRRTDDGALPIYDVSECMQRKTYTKGVDASTPSQSQ